MSKEIEVTVKEKKGLSASAKATLISGLACVLLAGVVLVFVITQFAPKSVETINWETYIPVLNSYPSANLIASDSNVTTAYKHAWRIYATKDTLAQVRQFYQDQFLGLGYKQDAAASAFPLEFYREQSNRCYYVRYGLDAVSLDENKLDLPDINSSDLKIRYPNQTLFVLHQLDTVTREPTC